MSFDSGEYPSDEVSTAADNVASVHDLARLLKIMALEAEGESWTNPSLDGYLEALSAWLIDSSSHDAPYITPLPLEPDWGHLAGMFVMGAAYE